jgi:hypothetical protein
MKNGLMFFALLLAGIMLVGCGNDDDAAKKNEFVLDGEVYSLEGVNFYLAQETTGCWGEAECDGDTHYYRTYVVTDGDYPAAASGCEEYAQLDGGCYTNPTFLLLIELGVPIEEGGFTPGSFSEIYNFLEIGPNDRFFSFDLARVVIGGMLYHRSLTTATGQRSAEVRGGFDNNQDLTVSYMGQAENSSTNEIVDFRLQFKGTARWRVLL